MSALERMARAGDRFFDRLRDRAAFDLSEAAAVNGSLESLRGHTYAVLVTFRKNGEAVPSPVWFCLDDLGSAYVKTALDVGKVKRIRRYDRVLIAPSTARGKPLGQAIKATARLLPPEDCPRVEAALASGYGLGRRLSEQFLGATGEAAYLEMSPRDP